MASETLTVKEEKLGEVIDVIRIGLRTATISENTRAHLVGWCREMEFYLQGSFYPEFWPKVGVLEMGKSERTD